MASTFGIILILFGAFVIAIGYQMLTDCLTNSSNSPCWSPRASGAFALYVGIGLAVAGGIVLTGPRLARLFAYESSSSVSTLLAFLGLKIEATSVSFHFHQQRFHLSNPRTRKTQ